MLRKFRVKLNDKEYIVEMEEIGAPVQQPVAQPAATPSSIETPSQPIQEASKVNLDVTGGTEIISPMPGNILDVCVNVGDIVAENQVLLVLEAMKMENNIVSPQAGTVVAVNINKGSAVDVGELMIVIK